jgi:sporulation protein YlmC with PRC-barrel domain
MASIYKSGHNVIGRIESNGYVYDQGGEYMGKVVDGDVYDKSGEYVGKVDASGAVYDFSGEFVGKVADDGTVFDADDNEIGESESPHMQSGGAALLLLFR